MNLSWNWQFIWLNADNSGEVKNSSLAVTNTTDSPMVCPACGAYQCAVALLPEQTMKYQVTLTVTFEQTFEMDAESEADAAQFAYDNFDTSEAECVHSDAEVFEVSAA
jgi:hypothetical protein